MKHLNARGKGEIRYDYANDILLFKTRGRDYLKSIDFDNIVVDLDKQGFITGIQIFDASKVFKRSKIALTNIKHFEFHSKAENNVIAIQLRFTYVLRNKPEIQQGHDFIREVLNSKINDSEVSCTVL
jgi:uncharacterized protein YuzE